MVAFFVTSCSIIFAGVLTPSESVHVLWPARVSLIELHATLNDFNTSEWCYMSSLLSAYVYTNSHLLCELNYRSMHKWHYFKVGFGILWRLINPKVQLMEWRVSTKYVHTQSQLLVTWCRYDIMSKNNKEQLRHNRLNSIYNFIIIILALQKFSFSKCLLLEWLALFRDGAF